MFSRLEDISNDWLRVECVISELTTEGNQVLNLTMEIGRALPSLIDLDLDVIIGNSIKASG